MHIVIGAMTTIYDATDELFRYCETHMKLDNPEYSKRERLGLWLGNTPKYLYLFETKAHTIRVPFGATNQILRFAQKSDEITWEARDPLPRVKLPEHVALYAYQTDAVKEMLRHRCGILQAPAGSGKTQMGLTIIAEIGLPALWITHTKDLLTQSYTRAVSMYGGGEKLGVISEGRVTIGSAVTFATVQTLANLDLSRYRTQWGVIIVDECHRVSGTPTTMTMFYHVLNSLYANYKYGLSATVHRADGLIGATYAMLGNIAYSIDNNTVNNYIMRVGIRKVNTGVELEDDCYNTDGVLVYQKAISQLVEDDGRNMLIVEQIKKNYNEPCLILSERKEQLYRLMRLLPSDMALKAVFLDCKTSAREREKGLNAMRTGEKKYLFATYALAKEGLDIPCLSRLFMASPQKDYAIITQSIGRIARLAPNKKTAICYDFVDYGIWFTRCWRKRCTTYNKNQCYYITGEYDER